MRSIIPYFLFAAIVFLFYGNTLANGFVHDDIWQVAQNPKIKSISSLPEIFSGCISEEILGGCQNRGFYWRPLQGVFYVLTNQISGSPTLFHLANLFYFFLAGSLLYRFLRLFKATAPIATLSTVFFLASPVNSEAVNWVSATPELLLSIFSLASLTFFVRYERSKKPVDLLISALAFFLALFSKETAIYLLLVLPPLKWALASFKLKRKELTGYFYTIIPYLFLALLYLFFRSLVLGRVIYQYEGFYTLSFASQVLTAFFLFSKYLEKLIYPLPLSFQPLIMPLTAPGLWILKPVVGLSVTLVLAFIAAKKRLKLAFSGIVLIVFSLIPVLIFVNKLGEFIFSERYLLIATIGLSLILADFVSLFSFKKAREQRFILAFLIFAFLVLAWSVVFQRVRDWHDNVASFEAMVRVDKNNKRAYFELGRIYQNQSQISLAKEQYKKALLIDPNYRDAQEALAKIAKNYQGKFIAFDYPAGWQVSEEKNSIEVSDREGKNKLEIDLAELGGQTFDSYLLNSKENYGTLKGQGLARIPNASAAYLKIWEINKSADLFEFFLLMREKVVIILAYPSNSPAIFDPIIGSITLR